MDLPRFETERVFKAHTAVRGNRIAFTHEMFSSFFGNELPLRVWTPFTIAHYVEFRHTGGLLDENSTPLLAALQAVRGIAWCNSSPSSVRHCLYSRSVPASIPELVSILRQHTNAHVSETHAANRIKI